MNRQLFFRYYFAQGIDMAILLAREMGITRAIIGKWLGQIDHAEYMPQIWPETGQIRIRGNF